MLFCTELVPRTSGFLIKTCDDFLILSFNMNQVFIIHFVHVCISRVIDITLYHITLL